MSSISCPLCGTEVSSPGAACPRCGWRSAAQADPATGTPARAAVPEIGLHPMSEVKLVVMALATLGFYELYWFYRNWRLRKQVRRSDVSPFWRTFFAPFFAFSLFEDVASEARELRVSRGWTPGEVGVAFFVLSLTWRLPDPFSLVSLFSFVPLVFVQRTINRVNERSANPAAVNARYSAWNIAGIVVGAVLLLLLLVGTFAPGE